MSNSWLIGRAYTTDLLAYPFTGPLPLH